MSDKTNEFVKPNDTTNQHHAVLSGDFATSTPEQLRQLTRPIDTSAQKYCHPFTIAGLDGKDSVIPIVPQPKQTDDPMRQKGDFPRGAFDKDQQSKPPIDIPQPKQTDDPMRQTGFPRSAFDEPHPLIDAANEAGTAGAAGAGATRIGSLADYKPIVEFPLPPSTPQDTHNIWNDHGFVKPINPADAKIDLDQLTHSCM
jgi:hypothetical protein